jgi:PPOX class probable F420-dependent enzyme
MNPSEIRSFMSAGTRTGKLATVRADGSPHVAPIWFTFDPASGDLVFMTWHTSLKAKNMRRDPRVSVCVDDESFPFAWARLDGRARFRQDDRVYWATETSRRYVGDDRAAEYGTRNGVEG